MGNIKLLLGFDFYGAGNIGDDLMVQGFLDVFGAVSIAPMTCSLPAERVASQRRRFDHIRWLSLSVADRKNAIPGFGCWVGVGGTPFQATHGPWLLNKIASDFDAAPGIKKLMVGVGCEREVLEQRTLAERILNETAVIWTRDEASRGILVEDLGADENRVRLGGDLAHIALKSIFPASAARSIAEDSLGIVYFSSPHEAENREALRKFVANLPSNTQPTFIANDVRKKGFEKSTFREMFGGWRRFKQKCPRFYAPNYERESVEGLVSHYRDFDVIMACRYHALLAAAWAGCRLVALDRSSKIRSLALALGIPLVSSPFTERTLSEGFQSAVRIPRELLETSCESASQSIVEFCRHIQR